MSPYIIAFVNQKGGSGKSKTVLGIAPELATMGRRVLVIDSDPQATVTNAILGRGQDLVGLAEVLGAGGEPEESRPKIDDVVIRSEVFGLDVLAANFRRLSICETELTGDSTRVAELSYALNAMTTPYDFVLIDTPGNLGPLVMGAVGAATHVVVVIDSGTEALEGFANLLGSLKRAAKISNFETLGVISTRFKANTDLSNVVLNAIKQSTKYRFYATVREATRIGSMNETKKPLSQTAKGRPEHLDFVKIAASIDTLVKNPDEINGGDRPADSIMAANA